MAKPVLALRGLLVTWVLMFLVATLGWAMTGVFAGQAWRIYFAGPGIGMCALLGILRLCGVPRLLVPLAGLVAMLFLATALFDGNTSVGGWLPTGQTLAHWSDLFAQANDLIVEASSPAPFSGAMAFVTAIGVCLLAVVLDLLALGFGVPALAGLVALAALVIPAGVVPEGLSFAAVAMVGVAVGLLCWSGTRPLPLPWALPSARRPGVSGRRRRRAALARGAAVVTVVTVAAAGSWWLAGQVPGLTHGPLVDALPKVMIFANGPDPLVDLGEDLTERTRKKALTVTTDRQFAPPYLRMMTVDDFSGDQWTHLPETVPSVAQATDGSLQLPSRFPPGLLGLRQDQTMTIDVSDMQSAWLPVPEYPTDVRGLSGQWQAQASDGTIRADRSQTRGQRFNVLTGQLDREAFDAVVRMVLPERIGVELSQSRELHCGGPLLDEVEGWTSQTPVIPEEVQPYLALPDDLPELIRQSAEEARWLNFGGLDWPVQIAADCQIYQAYALQDYFRNPQRFVYSTSLPDDQGFNNGGSQAVAAFLRAGSGYCVQFASAMALMARLLGIPARVALGFAPADQAEQTNDGRVIYTYTTRDLHAWPELYIPNLGWLSFEPTPGRGVTETPSNNPPALPSNDP
ncbi:MAG: DUF3488 and transglutaminase-like domain-containing protein, partial [Bifidobacteriaceae bacterium]|nr:DUF3488 and transglutaminase-like domain-containing protein [Bifidobacteriaceae bacterium]